MTVIATALKHLIAAGVTGDMLVAAIADIENALNSQAVDSQAERRRAKDRARKAEKKDAVPQNSAESAESAELEAVVPSPLVPPLSPAPLSPPIIPPTSLKSTKRGSRIPDDFQPDDGAWDLASKLNVTFAEFQSELSKFLDYWRSVPGAKGLKLDWQGTFRNWLRTYVERRGRNFSHGTRNPSKPNSITESLAAVDAVIDEIERREQAGGQGNR